MKNTQRKTQKISDEAENWERVCPICGKHFLVPPLNVYKLTIKGITYHYCSYTCFRVEQKKKEG